MLTKSPAFAGMPSAFEAQAKIAARIERLPITRPVFWARNIIGAATFFDGYTVLAIAYAMPVLVRELEAHPAGNRHDPFGRLSRPVDLARSYSARSPKRSGRLRVLLFTILLFVSMDIACLFTWSAGSMIICRFLQGIGTGGEVPVASAYINEYIGARQRGRFFLLYEAMFLVGLVGAGLIGYFTCARLWLEGDVHRRPCTVASS